MNTRATAAKFILEIVNNKSSLLTLDNKISKLEISDQDKSFIKLLCYEFFRNFFSLEKIVDSHISSKTKQKVKLLLMLGALQIFEINQPNYACINETVSACRDLNILWAKKLVNGVLRNILRNLEQLEPKYAKYKDFDLPSWLIEILKKQYPNNYKEISKAFNSKADMFLRLNTSRKTEKILNNFKDNNISYNLQNDLKNCIKLDKPINLEQSQLFKEGYFSVQDISAQYAGWIINPIDSDSILDACAAPGGKTTHILELAPNAKITAIDIIEKRLNLLNDNLKRISNDHKVNILKQDLTKLFAGKFNKIILDAPCTALGTIKRNPDIKVLRQIKDIENINILQNKILQNLWNNNLTQDGYILYITCSILKQENQDLIKSFLTKNPDAEMIPITLLEKYKTDYGYQIPPSLDKGDGFYYCLIRKKTI